MVGSEHEARAVSVTMARNEPRLGWKIFAGLSFAAFVVGVFTRTSHVILPWVDWLALPFDVVAIMGVASYAFHMPVGKPGFWRMFSLAYPGWAVLSIVVAIVRSSGTFNAGTAKAMGASTGVILASTLFYFNWLAVRRLSERVSNSST
jgi:hypothetical protein